MRPGVTPFVEVVLNISSANGRRANAGCRRHTCHQFFIPKGDSDVPFGFLKNGDTLDNGEYVWTAENNYFGWRALLGHEPGIEGVSPYASAPRAEYLAGLPATFISVGAIDLFADECIDYAKRLIHAGVPTELHVYPGAHHGAALATEARITKAEQQARLEALRRAFFG